MYVTPNGDVACKIILYGPAGSGRSTFLHGLHQHLSSGDISDVETIDLEGEPAQAFIWKSGSQVQVQGRSLVLTVITLSGRSRYQQARRRLVEASDGVIFIADTRSTQLDNDIDAMNDLMDHLRAHHLPEQLPTVIAYNRQDDPEALATRQLDPLLNHFSAPSIETVAIQGKGVDATWLTIISMLVPEAEAGLDELSQGPEPTLSPANESGWLLACHACGSMLEVESAAIGDVFTCGSCGATLKVIDPETGRTGPVANTPSTTGGSHYSGGVHPSQTGPLESQSYGLQSLPSPALGLEPLSPTATGTGPISAAKPFELAGFDLLKELDSSPLGQRFRLYERERQRKVRAFRIDATVVASPGYRVQIEPYVRMAAKVRHPHIVSIIGLRWQGNRPYLISEDTPNFENLSSMLARRRRLSASQALEIGHHIAVALEEAARHGVIHGFLRPDVVLISPENQVMIDGLGIPKAHAHLIQALEGQSPSTEYYLAPEHLLVDAPSDIRSDMFLLGALLYRMITAEGLITGFNAVEALHRFNATGTGTLSASGAQGLPKELISLLGKLTAADRRDRFQHYGEAIEAIERVMGQLERRTATGNTGNTKRNRGPRTGSFARGTGTISGGTGPIRNTGTGAVRPTTTARRVGTGPVRGGGRGTGPVTRGTRRDGELGTMSGLERQRMRRKKAVISGPALVMVTVLMVALLAGVGYVIYLQTQKPTRITYDSDGRITEVSASTADQNTVHPTMAAQRAVAVYAGDPNDERLYEAARQAVSKVSGQSRAALDQRLRNLREQHGRPPAPTPTVTAIPPPEEQSTATTDPVADPATDPATPPNTDSPPAAQPTATQLSARQQEELARMRREQRFGEALNYVRAQLAPGEVHDFYLTDVRDEYIRTRTLVEQQAQEANSREQLQGLLAPALSHWGMNDGDQAWAQKLLDDGLQRLAEQGPPATTPPQTADQSPATEEATGGTADATQTTNGAESASGFTLPERSPAGFTQAELAADAALCKVLTTADAQPSAADQVVEQLPATSPNLNIVALRRDLWFRGPAAIQAAIGLGARLRVNNPIAGGQWDVVSADQRGLVIRNPTGSSMSLQWNAVATDELSNLYQQLNRIGDLPSDHLAAAAAIHLTLGQQTRAALTARQAQQAGYAQAEALNQLLSLERDRQIMALLTQGIEANRQLDPFTLGEVIAGLEAPALGQGPLTASAATYFKERREAIMSGAAGNQENPRDQLTFDNPEDRLAFNRRSGWMIANSAYSNMNEGPLQRDDLGNAESMSASFSLSNLEGSFRFIFRGVEVIANVQGKQITLRGAGVNTELKQSFTFSTNTMYTLNMTYKRATNAMEVTLNRLEPLTVGLPRANSSLIISADGGSQIALDEITISRFGQSPPPDQEELASRQEALRSLGLIPYGATIKDPESPAILIPAGESMSGLGIPLRSGDRGIRFKATGDGKLKIRVGVQNRGTEGNYIEFDVPENGQEPADITVTITEGLWELVVTIPDGSPIFLEQDLPAGANNVVVLGEKNLTILSTPEAIR